MTSSDSVQSLLLISPNTYNYHKILFDACNHSAINLVWLDERPYSSAFFKLLSRKLNKLVRKLSVQHYLSRLKEIKLSGFLPTHILVIKGESVDPSIIDYMRIAFPGAKLILYFWDSTKNLPGYAKLASRFDIVASFDSLDCKSNGWRYHPLFCGNPAVTEKVNTSI